MKKKNLKEIKRMEIQGVRCVCDEGRMAWEKKTTIKGRSKKSKGTCGENSHWQYGGTVLSLGAKKCH